MSAAPASLRDAGFEPIQWQGRETYARPGEWIVKIDGLNGARGKQLKAANALLAGSGVSARKQLGADGLLLVESAPAAGIDHLRNALQRVPGFQYIEPNFAFGVEQTPNDADFGRLWGLHNTNDADIDAPEAWDLSTGGGSSVVGVIDTGIDYNHPDLKANMWVNPFEIAGNGIDDEGNGYTDDVYGANFITGSGNPMDDQGHGTHVAGTIGGVGNNGTGMTGVNWNAQVMGLKFLAANGYGTGADAIEALYYTMDMKRRGVNVTVTNNSYGGEPFSRAFYDALRASGDAGQLFIAAAGNGDWLGRPINNDTTPHFPSSYGHDGRTFDDPATSVIESLPSLDNVIAVTATDSNDAKGSWANYGVKSVDLGAPGVNIWSLAIGGGYTYSSGTSMASPHVAGAAALAWSYNPSATAAQVKAAILDGADPVSSLATNTSTGGRLNVRNMLEAVPVTTPPDAPASLTATAVSSNKISLAWSNVERESGYRVQRLDAGTGQWVQVGSTIANVTTFTDSGLSAGTLYTYRIEAYNPAGAAYSTERSATTENPTVPEAPSGLTAAASGPTAVQLTWTDNAASEAGFEIERFDGVNYTYVTLPADTTSYSDGELASATAYTYRVRATSAAGASTYSNAATVTTAGTGTGLRADYYDNMLTESSSDPSAFSLGGWKFARTDATVNFTWGTGAPDGGTRKTRLAGDTFTVKWSGMVQPRYTDDYVFRFEPDDGVGMWITIDGEKRPLWTPTWDRLDGKSGNGTSSEYANTTAHESASLALKAGEKYPIEIVYYEYTGGAQAKLMWRSAQFQQQEVIPQSQLYHAPTELTATPVSATSIGLTWSDNSAGETGFKIERSTNGSTWTQIAATTASNNGATASYTATALTAGTTYYFRVRSYTGSPAFNSNYSNVATAKAGATATTASAQRPDAASVFGTQSIEDSLLEELEAALT